MERPAASTLPSRRRGHDFPADATRTFVTGAQGHITCLDAAFIGNRPVEAAGHAGAVAVFRMR